MGGHKSKIANVNKLHNYSIIWVDSNIDVSNEDFKNSLTELRSVVDKVILCKTTTDCIQLLNNIDGEKAFIISSGSLGQNLISDIHEISNVDTIYIFCSNKTFHEQWAIKWPKIQGVFTSIKPICKSLKKVVRECDDDEMPMSFLSNETIAMATIRGYEKTNLDQLDPSYMYSVIFKDIILEIKDDHTKQMYDLTAYCRKKQIIESQLNDFQNRYYQESPIWWYTNEIFLYGMLNRALRLLDMEGMAKMGFFIRDLHLQLEKLHQEQAVNFRESFTVYRGQGLTKQDFQKLYNIKGGLLSFNNFLSTSKEKTEAMNFVRRAMDKNKSIIGILFVIKIDPSKVSTSQTPFALINDYSAIPSENEILFTMHTVFRVIDIKQSNRNARIWEIQLIFTDDRDTQLATLTNCIKNEISGSGWHRMGKLMHKLGHFKQAEELYNELLENDAMKDNDPAHIYHKLGWSLFNQAKFNEAIISLSKSLETYQKFLPENHPSLAELYNDMGVIQQHIGDYSKALEFLEKGLCLRKIAFAEYPQDIAESYSNIGGVYDNIGEYLKALEFYENAHQIYETVLPPNHPDLATCYNNIGLVYKNKGDYSKALEFCEKAYRVYDKILPEDHPDLATSYNNIGLIYNNMGDYSRALELLEKSLKIRENVLSPSHPHMAITYSNIAEVYNNMGNYSKALELYQKSHEIYEKVLPMHHPDLATSYNNIGFVYDNMGDYPRALEYYEKSLNIRENVLSANHPHLATSYANIGGVYNTMGDYLKAIEYYHKSMTIHKKNNLPNHPDLAASYSSIGLMYNNIGDDSKAIEFFEEALSILQKSLPSTHPNIKSLMNAIDSTKKKNMQ